MKQFILLSQYCQITSIVMKTFKHIFKILLTFFRIFYLDKNLII